MDNLIKKVTAVGLCVTLGLSSVGMASAQVTNKIENTDAAKKQAEILQQAATKDETVYVLAGADGTVDKIIVSDWIKNAMGSKQIFDKSILSDIENIKGDESYTIDEQNLKIWDTEGNDIYYKGTAKKELPVGVSVTYKLDGKTISPEKLAGKSGKVTIRFEYENRQFETVTIDGKAEKIYVPFAMLTGILLDSDSFSNIEVSNGKLINDGDRTAVVGIAFPGLQENLAVSRSKIDIPNYVEITANVKDFEMGATVTIASNDVFNEIDSSKLNSVDEMLSSFGDLSSAMNELLDGSSLLYDGMNTLMTKSDELVKGIDKLAVGTTLLKDGADSLDEGASNLNAGVKELSEGLSYLSSNSQNLNAGATQVFNTLLDTATVHVKNAGISIPKLTISNYGDVLNGVIGSLDENAVYEKVYMAVREQVIKSGTGMSVEAYESAVAAGAISQEQQTMIEYAVSEQMSSDAVKAQLQTASEGAKQIAALKTSLDSYNSFYVGLNTYTKGVDSASAGAAELVDGTSELKVGSSSLKTGIGSLYDGVFEMKGKIPTLTKGISDLKDGSMNLSAGLKQFNEEGIEKISKLLEGEIGSVATRLKATVEVSKYYNNYAGIGDNMDGKVKFIYSTDEISLPEKTK